MVSLLKASKPVCRQVCNANVSRPYRLFFAGVLPECLTCMQFRSRQLHWEWLRLAPM
jgi:hypothetical protein